MIEEWRAVVGFEGLYEVSDAGRVRSLDRIVPVTGQGVRRVPGRVLRPGRHRDGYDLYSLGRGKKTTGHKLVLEAFVGPCPDGHEGAHGDGNPQNNARGNLRWATPTENHADKIRHGTTRKARRAPEGAAAG